MRVRFTTASTPCLRLHARRREQRRRIAPLVLACSVLLLLLAGCGNITFQSSFEKDGTARHQVTLTFDRDDLLPQDVSRIERGLDGVRQRATADGFTVQRISTSSEIGLRVVSDSMDATDVGAALNILFNTMLPTSADAPVAPFTGTFGRESGAVGGNRFELALQADGQVLFEALRAVSPLSPQMQTPTSMSSVIRVRVIAILPGEVNESNGSVAGDRVTWVVPFTGTTELHATSAIGQSTPWLGVVGVSVLAIVATGAAGYWGWTLLKHRNIVRRMVHIEPTATHGDTQVRTLPGLLRRLEQVGLHFVTDPRPPRQPRQTRAGRSGRRPADADELAVAPESVAEERMQHAVDTVVHAATETRETPVDAFGREMVDGAPGGRKRGKGKGRDRNHGTDAEGN